MEKENNPELICYNGLFDGKQKDIIWINNINKKKNQW